MKQIIEIRPSRILLIHGTGYVGTIGENNATILKFVKPYEINGESVDYFVMRLILETSEDRYLVEMEDDEITLDDRYTGSDKLIIAVQFLKEDEVKWQSKPLTLNFSKSLSDEENYRNYLNFLDINADGEYLEIEWDGNLDINIDGDYMEVEI